MFPSFWSLAAFLLPGGTLLTVTLEGIADAFTVTQNNGVGECRIEAYDDPSLFPNIAAIDFPTGGDASFAEDVAVVRADRTIVDIPSLMLKWLAYVWGTETAGNPLLAGAALPCAAFVNAVASLARVHLSPSLSSNAACPEAIWQAAKWWRSFYEGALPASGAEGAWLPKGVSWIRQPAAMIVEP